MKVFVTGTRGIPNIPGGVEAHCSQLYPLLAQQGFNIRIARRASYVKEKIVFWRGISLVDLFSPKSKSFEAIVHTLLALLEAKKWGADIMHIHAIGPGLMVPVARLMGMKVVFTHHGSDYERANWGWVARTILKLGEKLSGLYANKVIAISDIIQGTLERRCGRQSTLIFNGVKIRERTKEYKYLDTLELKPEKYILVVARFVPEKGLHVLLEAYSNIDRDIKLVIAGDADHETQYSRDLKSKAAKSSNIILTGYIVGEELHQLYSHAKLFVLPSFHEGLPIALLEALSYGLRPLASDIPANERVPISKDHYFKVGSTSDLQEKITNFLDGKTEQLNESSYIEMAEKYYSWPKIAVQTADIYKSLK